MRVIAPEPSAQASTCARESSLISRQASAAVGEPGLPALKSTSRRSPRLTVAAPLASMRARNRWTSLARRALEDHSVGRSRLRAVPEAVRC